MNTINDHISDGNYGVEEQNYDEGMLVFKECMLCHTR